MPGADNELQGRLVLITGASGGIGATCARHFAKLGCHLALTYSTNPDSAQQLVEELRKSSDWSEKLGSQWRITTHKADMASPEQITKLCEDVQKEHGRAVDVLIPNAGYGKRIRDVSDIPLDEWEYMINVNLRAPFLLVKGCVDGMKAQKWGRIIFVSSIAAYGGGINGCHYAASKGGMQGMMRNLATCLTPWNISVNDVSPAMVGGTGMMAKAAPEVVAGIPLGRLGEPDEVANAVVMFAKSGYTTGQSLVIAGGLK